jgi:quinol-cytochrome oxidoreductase complex cytochrome b subunit
MTSTEDVSADPHHQGVDGWQRVGRISGWIAAVGLVAVTVSGVWLYLNYQPTAATAFSDIGSTNRSVQWQAGHRVSSIVSAVALLICSGVVAVRYGMRRRLYGLATVVVFAIAAYSGSFLPWDQMALQAITVGTNMSGFSAIFDQEDITFLLIDGSEVSVASLRRWLVAHLFLGGLSVLAVLVPLAGGVAKGSGAASAHG